MSPARIHVRAVVVSDGESPRLASVVDAVIHQDPAPDRVDLVLVGDAPAPDPLPPSVHAVQVTATDFSSAVHALIVDEEAQPGEMLWLLHDDSAPMPDALGLLLATARKRHRAGIIGAAQVQWDDPTRLVSMGTTTTRGGARRVTLVDEGDINQGQHDERDDVLGVSITGALVRREVWDQLRGLDPAYDGWGDSLDFCRRVWRAQWDVVVVPRARIRHAQERLNGGRGEGGSRLHTYGARRASEWLQALVYARWWMGLPLLIGVALSTLGRVLMRVAQNNLRLAGADAWVPMRLLVLLPRVYRSRQRVNAAGLRGSDARTIEHPLLASSRQVRRDTRTREWGAYESWRAASVPPELIRNELAVVARRRRITLVSVAALLAAVSTVRHYDWISGVLSGQMLASESLGITDVGWRTLWERGLSGWTEQGLGAPSIDGGLSVVLLPLTVVPGGLAVGLGLLLAGASLWAGLGAWAAAGALTRSLAVRAAAAMAYGLMPFLIESVDQGRVASVIVHVMLPWVVVGVVRAGGWQCTERISDGVHFPERALPSPSAAAGGALSMAVVVIAAPALVLPVLLSVAVVGACAGPMRLRVWGMGIPPAVVGFAGLVAIVQQGLISRDAWTVLMREPGPSISDSSSALDILLAPVSVSSAPDIFLAASSVVVPVLLVVAFLSTFVARRWAMATTGVALAAMGVLWGALSLSTLVSPDGGAGTASANAWAGPGLSLAVMGVLIAVASAAEGLWDAGSGKLRVTSRVFQSIAASAVVVVVLGHGVAVAWPVASEDSEISAVSQDVLPLVAGLELEQPTRQRVLVLDDAESGISATVTSTDGSDAITTAGELVSDDRSATRTTGISVVGTSALAPIVADLVGGAQGAPAQIAEWGIGVVIAAPGAERAASALGQSDALQLIGSSERGTSWRVKRAGDEAPVSRAWVAADDGGVTVVEMGRTTGSVTLTEPVTGNVVLAVSDDEAWTATLDGATLPKVEDESGRAVFAVDGEGVLEIVYDDSAHRFWWWMSIVVVAWAAIAAIPLPTRTFREVSA
ncbi:glycosyltransferase family 2 protein [Demequina sediminicola]|uniref:glycosyltransferase family 2 protein n=1 Tax=Demequina sediminicola TaxID=1095026 RepID=UPI000780B69C|nr:glycosyltransferase [Demequina sediminicola]